MSKHPELHVDLLRTGISYACAYMRLENGWSLERAISEPVHKRRTAAERHALYAAKRERIAKRVLTPGPRSTTRTRYVPKANDTSPAHVRRLRAAYCDTFIKTGVLDPGMTAKLKDYADASRSSVVDPPRVSGQPQTQAHRRGRSEVGDVRAGDAAQTERL